MGYSRINYARMEYKWNVWTSSHNHKDKVYCIRWNYRMSNTIHSDVDTQTETLVSSITLPATEAGKRDLNSSEEISNTNSVLLKSYVTTPNTETWIKGIVTSEKTPEE